MQFKLGSLRPAQLNLKIKCRQTGSGQTHRGEIHNDAWKIQEDRIKHTRNIFSLSLFLFLNKLLVVFKLICMVFMVYFLKKYHFVIYTSVYIIRMYRSVKTDSKAKNDNRVKESKINKITCFQAVWTRLKKAADLRLPDYHKMLAQEVWWCSYLSGLLNFVNILVQCPSNLPFCF